MGKQKEFNLSVTPEQALAKYLEVDIEEAEQLIKDGDYLVLTDEEADEKAKEAVIDSLWAFNASFIIGECGLDYSGEESLQKMQETACEGAQDFIRSLIEKTCGIDEFVDSAISADGRGHFIAQYDFEEGEEGEYFIYRVN
jgi:hypothetical protein